MRFIFIKFYLTLGILAACTPGQTPTYSGETGESSSQTPDGFNGSRIADTDDYEYIGGNSNPSIKIVSQEYVPYRPVGSIYSSSQTTTIPKPTTSPTVAPKPTTGSTGDVTTCSTKVVGPQITFIVDNSGSNYGPYLGGIYTTPTDCPGRTPTATPTVYTCQGETFRKQAVVKTANYLKSIPNMTNSYLSVVQFAASGKTVLSNFAITPTANMNPVSEVMEFTKQPYGDTIYSSAFQAAGNIAKPAGDRPRVIILLTDGLPNDSPSVILAAASKLRNAGYKIFTIIYTANTSFETLAKEWYDTSDKIPVTDRDWVVGRGRNSIISDISDQVYLLKNTAEMPNLVTQLTQKNGLGCAN